MRLSEIIQKNCMPFTLRLPVEITCKTMLEYYDQNIDFDKIHQSHSSFPSFMFIPVYMLFSSKQFIRYRFLYHQSQDSEQFSKKNPSLLFCNHTHPSSTLCHPCLLAVTNLFSISKILSFKKYYINGIIHYIPFWS